ncbi:hypothetical protein FC093_18385 [Ilyomonas limi]|uniref:Uncharacterized protein n=1 Tax=Ilyomonas limi TaxID=2575867 RepID=A0A4U3KUE9_9BACT|nr:hypothetical protein [Ilyomonas limi]TKK65972.1 hypothetical protein FC093_18385 [Ilyomonas limi]
MKTLTMLLLASLCLVSSFTNADKYYVIKQILEDHKYTIVKDIYGYIAQGETVYYYKTFYANTTYAIYGFSEDENVNDLDIEVQYSDGTTYMNDSGSDDEPVVVFTPSYTRTMKVVLKNYSSYTPDDESRCEFLIAAK